MIMILCWKTELDIIFIRKSRVDLFAIKGMVLVSAFLDICSVPNTFLGIPPILFWAYPQYFFGHIPSTFETYMHFAQYCSGQTLTLCPAKLNFLSRLSSEMIVVMKVIKDSLGMASVHL